MDGILRFINTLIIIIITLLLSSLFLFLFQLMEFYERVSGARLHAAYVRPGGVALVSFKHFVRDSWSRYLRNLIWDF